MLEARRNKAHQRRNQSGNENRNHRNEQNQRKIQNVKHRGRRCEKSVYRAARQKDCECDRKVQHIQRDDLRRDDDASLDRKRKEHVVVLGAENQGFRIGNGGDQRQKRSRQHNEKRERLNHAAFGKSGGIHKLINGGERRD